MRRDFELFFIVVMTIGICNEVNVSGVILERTLKLLPFVKPKSSSNIRGHQSVCLITRHLNKRFMKRHKEKIFAELTSSDLRQQKVRLIF